MAFERVFILSALLCHFSLATDCSSRSCSDSFDETSLVQVKKTVTSGGEREADSKKTINEHEKTDVKKTDSDQAKSESAPSNKKAQQQQYPAQFASAGMTAQQQSTGMAAAGSQQGYYPASAFGQTYQGYATGYAPTATDYHYNSVAVQSQVSPGGGQEDPRRAAAHAAEMEEHAERAMEDAVWKAQQEERAAMFASKRAAALRAAAEKAAVAENTAARTQIQAADSMENAAVRKAATDRTHARVAAYKALVSQATAYQATADQTFAAQRAAAARAAVETAKVGLHNMQDDTDASDHLFNDRDARKYDRHRYHDAMDNINFDRERFRSEDEDEDYDTDEDEDYRGHFIAEGGYGGGRGIVGGVAPGGTCAEFTCPHPMLPMAGVIGLRCRGMRCRRRCCAHSCSRFRGTCTAPMMAVPQPEIVACGPRGCKEDTCCSAVQACAIGDMVDATYAGDGQNYRAKIAAMQPDGQYAVAWLDGFDEGDLIPAASVFKAGQPCSGMGMGAGMGMAPGVGMAAAAAAPMAAAAGNPLAAAGFPMVALQVNKTRSK